MGTTPTNSESSSAQVSNQINNVARDVQALQTTQIFKDDTGTRRVLLGKGADGFYGLKVSKVGEDVYDAGNDDLIFNSSQNVFKIVSSGTASIAFAADGTTETTTIAHGLGYKPIVFAFINQSGISQTLPHVGVYIGGANAGKTYQIISWGVDSTNVYFYNQSQLQGTASPDITYYLLQETAN